MANPEKPRLLITAASLLMTLPRTVFAYPFYTTAPLLLIDYKRSGQKPRIVFLALCLMLLGSYFILSRQYSLSLTAFILELVLIAPLLIFISGFKLAFTGQTCLYAIRLINFVCIITGFYNLTTKGFPFLLPYLDYLPDEFSATYGWGGARIVTVFGFLGILGEIALSPTGAKKKLWLTISACNFLLPNYLIGIASGALSFLLLGLKRPASLVFPLILGMPIAGYALMRIARLESDFYLATGWLPKLYGHNLAFQTIMTDYKTVVFGTGLGQFSSTAQLWTNSIFSPSSIHSIPKLPMLFPSEFHLTAFAPLMEFVEANRLTFSSAINKPYTGLTTLVTELGLTSLVILFLFSRRAYFLSRHNRPLVCFFAFFILLNLIDQWIDNPWLGYSLLLATGILSRSSTADSSKLSS